MQDERGLAEEPDAAAQEPKPLRRQRRHQPDLRDAEIVAVPARPSVKCRAEESGDGLESLGVRRKAGSREVGAGAHERKRKTRSRSSGPCAEAETADFDGAKRLRQR